MTPYFSIIIPMYNRERFIARAINSCLKQDFGNFEIIVVDDGSTDTSVKVVQEINDPRIRLIRHETNQERLIARNTGARAATGEWLVWFDSDDELVPEALDVMKRRIYELPKDVLGLRFMCRLDSGRISPEKPYQDEIWDYEGYIRWVEAHYGKWSEALPVVCRSTISEVLFPEDPLYTGEMQYHLDFCYRFRISACNDMLRMYHLDAGNNTWNLDIGKMMDTASLFAARLQQVISSHGYALQRWAPKTYYKVFCGMITQLLLSGRRKGAWAAFPHALRKNPFNLRAWSIMTLGMINPTLLAHGKVRRERARIAHLL